MAEAPYTYPIHDLRKALHALFPYAVSLARDGQQGMADTLSRIAKDSSSIFRNLTWKHIVMYIIPLFGEPATPLDSVIALASHHVPWRSNLVDEDTVTRWAATASAAPYTKEVGRSVVDALLQIASVDALRPYIPIGIWAWLKKRPSLLYGFLEQSDGSRGGVVCHVRALGDVKILKSYFLLVWSEWNLIDDESGGFAEMQISIHEDFGGIGMGRHREDLIKRLDHVLTRLDVRIHLTSPDPKIGPAMERYGELKRALEKLDRDATNLLTRASPRLILFGLLTPVDTHRIPLDLRVRLASSISIVSHLGNIALLPLTDREVVCTVIDSYCNHRVSSPSPFVIIWPKRALTYIYHLNFPGGQWTSREIFRSTLVIEVPLGRVFHSVSQFHVILVEPQRFILFSFSLILEDRS